MRNANVSRRVGACYEASRVLQYIGLTAGEAFVVVYVACAIITAAYWPKMGSWLMTRLMAVKSPETREK